MKKFIENNVYSLLSLILSIVIFIIALYLVGVIGVGNYTIAFSDLSEQYIPFIQSFIRVLKGKEDFYYSFSNYLGGNSVMKYAYYTLSPFNLLYLWEDLPITFVTTIIIIAKVGLSSLSFSVYEKDGLHCNNVFNLIFALSYGLCSFIITMHFNIMWLDAFYILPFIILQIMNLVMNGKYILLILSYSYLFFTNFYMGYIIGVFSFAFFVGYIFLRHSANSDISLKNKVIIIAKYSVSVLFSIGLSAAILLPTFFSLFNENSARTSNEVVNVISIFDILNSLFIGSMVSLDSFVPQLYSGILALIFLPCYFLFTKYTKKEKLIAAISLILLVFLCVVPELYKFIHAFDAPNMMGFRFAFIGVFIICSLGVRTSFQLESIEFKGVIVYSCIILFLYSMLIPWYLKVYPEYRTNTQELFLINSFFIILWILLLFSLKKKVKSKLCKGIMLGVISIEMLINACLCMELYKDWRISEDRYYSWYNAEKEAINEIKSNDDGLYRISVNNSICENAPSMFGYNSLVSYMSSYNYRLDSAMSHLGINACGNIMMNGGSTDITDMLLGIRYYVDLCDGEYNIYNNENALDFGFMVSEKTLNYQPCNNPFVNQQNLINLMTDGEYCFYDEISESDIELSTLNLTFQKQDVGTFFSRESNLATGCVAEYRVHGSKFPVYGCFFFNNPGIYSGIPYVISDEWGRTDETLLSYGGIRKLCPDGADYTISIYSYNPGMKSFFYNDAFWTSYNSGALKECYGDLRRNPVTIKCLEDSVIGAYVHSSRERTLLFTSIPYENGWNAYVDGNLVDIVPLIEDSFIGVNVPEGEHDVVLIYTAPGCYEGIVISILTFSIFLVIIVIELFKRGNYEK